MFCLHACMYGLYVYIFVEVRTRNGVTGHCESTYGCWELNSCPLQEQLNNRIISAAPVNDYFNNVSVVYYHKPGG